MPSKDLPRLFGLPLTHHYRLVADVDEDSKRVVFGVVLTRGSNEMLYETDAAGASVLLQMQAKADKG